MFDKLTVRYRILCGFALVLFLFLGAAGGGAYRSLDVSKQTDAILTDKLRNERLIHELKAIIDVNVLQTIAAARSTDQRYSAALTASILRGSERATAIYDQLGKNITNPEARDTLDKVIAQRKRYRAARDHLFELKAQAGADAVNTYIDETFHRETDAYTEAVDALLRCELNLIDELGKDIQTTNTASIQTNAALTLLAALCCVFSALVVARSILRQLGGEPATAADIARRIAEGNLAAAIDIAPGDTSSVLYSMRAMRDRLAAIVLQVRRGAVEIQAASNEVAQGSLELSARTEHQASSLEETAASMEELTVTVKQNGDHTAQAHELASSAEAMAGEGEQAVAALVSTMETIKDSSQQIAAIITVIEGIAFQTNILALNAAVEAARAGEQGRGFAVVASEVRTLAQRSAAAAKDIKHLIEKSAGDVLQGTERVSAARAKIEAVLDRFSAVSQVIADIAMASKEQTTGIEQVNAAVVEMDSMTQQNAAMVEEATAAAQAVRQQSDALAQLVAFFRIDQPLTAPNTNKRFSHSLALAH